MISRRLLHDMLEWYDVNRGFWHRIITRVSRGSWPKPDPDILALENAFPRIQSAKQQSDVLDTPLTEVEIAELKNILCARHTRLSHAAGKHNPTYAKAPLHPVNEVFYAIAKALCLAQGHDDHLAVMQMLTNGDKAHVQDEIHVHTSPPIYTICAREYFYFPNNNANEEPQSVTENTLVAHGLLSEHGKLIEGAALNGQEIHFKAKRDAAGGPVFIKQSAVNSNNQQQIQNINDKTKGYFQTDDDIIYALQDLIEQDDCFHLPYPHMRSLTRNEISRLLSLNPEDLSPDAKQQWQAIKLCYDKRVFKDIPEAAIRALEVFAYKLDIHQGGNDAANDGPSKEISDVDYTFINEFKNFLTSLDTDTRKKFLALHVDIHYPRPLNIATLLLEPELDFFFYGRKTIDDPLEKKITSIREELHSRYGDLHQYDTIGLLALVNELGIGQKITLNTGNYCTLRDLFLSLIIVGGNFVNSHEERPCNEAARDAIKALVKRLKKTTRSCFIITPFVTLCKNIFFKIFHNPHAFTAEQINHITTSLDKKNSRTDLTCNFDNVSLAKLCNPLRWIEYIATLSVETAFKLLPRFTLLQSLLFCVSLILTNIAPLTHIFLPIFITSIATGCLLLATRAISARTYHALLQGYQILCQSIKTTILSWIGLLTSPMQNLIKPMLQILHQQPRRAIAGGILMMAAAFTTVFMCGSIGWHTGLLLVVEKILLSLAATALLIAPALALLTKKTSPRCTHKNIDLSPPRTVAFLTPVQAIINPHVPADTFAKPIGDGPATSNWTSVLKTENPPQQNIHVELMTPSYYGATHRRGRGTAWPNTLKDTPFPAERKMQSSHLPPPTLKRSRSTPARMG